ncbi:hypothetical protein CPB83DRAFT_895303 [Crepidotus variabilis]|uniref:Uncharacterized protein n=1 Tax=Crepidotus variabilis TaxID=179855 RepID=A0A9P6JND6_9AGAR|nr:hypothetical protein CPB83DRAFT_895303 [Crepidotus variabilis]
MVVVVRDIAAPEEVDVPSRVSKPTPYAVCFGCNGSVQTDVHEVNRAMINETWHAECYEAEQDVEAES